MKTNQEFKAILEDLLRKSTIEEQNHLSAIKFMPSKVAATEAVNWMAVSVYSERLIELLSKIKE